MNGNFFPLLFFLTTFIFLSKDSIGQDNPAQEEPAFSYEEVSMLLVVEGQGKYHLNTIITESNQVYVSIEDIFNINEIAFKSSYTGDTINGFIRKEDNAYFLNYRTGQFIIGDVSKNISGKLTKLLGAVYMEYSLFGELFGLKLTYNQRSLSFDLNADFETPAAKRIKLEMSHKGFGPKKEGDIKPDIIVNRKYNLFKPGYLDWNVSSTQSKREPFAGNARVGYSSELLYGGANVVVPVESNGKIDSERLLYSWRWVDNDISYIRQASVGKIIIPSLVTLPTDIIGIGINNTPTTLRRATGYYTIADYTQPNWTVELYINNSLQSFTKADASGWFMFKIPVSYGYTSVTLKLIGNRGEERTEERFFYSPNNILPARRFQYFANAAMTNDSLLKGITNAEGLYGLHKYSTMAAGIEVLNYSNSPVSMPYVKLTTQLFNKILLYNEFVLDQRVRSVVNIYPKVNSILTLDYTSYYPGYVTIGKSLKEARKVSLTYPYVFGKVRLNCKMDVSDISWYKKNEQSGPNNSQQISSILSLNRRRINVNSTSAFTLFDYKNTSSSTSLFASYYTKSNYIFNANLEYDLTRKNYKSFKIDCQKVFKYGVISIVYERQIVSKLDLFTFNLRLNLKGLKFNFSSAYSDKEISFSESALGSIGISSGKPIVNNNSMFNKGALVVYYFLDMNTNNIFDEGEPKVEIKSFKINTSRVERNIKDTSIIAYDLPAYNNIILENEIKELPNISWRYTYPIYKIKVDPHQFKRINIPIQVVGEVNGYVYNNSDSSNVLGIGKIIIKFQSLSNPDQVYSIQTESDGYYSFLGLPIGEYSAEIDSQQLKKIHYITKSDPQNFVIKKSFEGDIIEGIDFYISKK